MLDTEEAVPFEAVWTELGLPAPLPPLAFGATITARTLASDAPPPGLPEGTAEAPPAIEGAISMHTLPRISLAHGGAEGRERAGEIARHLADLEIVGTLGEGGMGRVHLARQRSLNREVAVKVVKAEIQDPGALEALLVEALIMGRLEHPSIIPVHALGLDDEGRPILVMKRVEGVSWRELLIDPEHTAWSKLDAPSPDRLGANLQILMQVCSAAALAHSRGVIHRDIKPENVMVGEFGEVYLVDWGLAARIGRTAPPHLGLRGTPAYMAPEMISCRAGEMNERTDVYLLGATLHELLTGKPRHEGATLVEVLRAAWASRPYAYDAAVPAELAEICSRATHADPAQRYPSANALRHALAEHLRHRGAIALSTTAAERLAEARAALAAGPPAPSDAERAQRLMTECRFGFMQALRAWSENPDARAGLEGCLEIMIEHHVAQGSAAAARGLLGELPAPRPDLERRVAALEADIQRQREGEVRLRRMEEDLDLSVAARQRSAIFLAMGVIIAAIAFAVLRTGRVGTMTHRHLIVIACVQLSAVTAAVAIGRRHLLKNAINRRMVGLIYVVIGAVLAHRVIASARSMPTWEVIADDLLIAAAVMAAGGIAIVRWFWAFAATFGGAALFCFLRPDLSAQAFVSTGFAVVALGFFMWWVRRAKPKPR